MTADGKNDALIVAVERRLAWAREKLVSDEWTDTEKIWMRRYEIDVAALVAALAEAAA